MADRRAPEIYSIAAHRGFADALVAGGALVGMDCVPRLVRPAKWYPAVHAGSGCDDCSDEQWSSRKQVHAPMLDGVYDRRQALVPSGIFFLPARGGCFPQRPGLTDLPKELSIEAP